MASENETVAEIVKETTSAIDYGDGVLLDLDGKQVIDILGRIESARRREIAELESVIADNDRVSRAVRLCCSDEKLELSGEIVRRDETRRSLNCASASKRRLPRDSALVGQGGRVHCAARTVKPRNGARRREGAKSEDK